MQQKIKLALIGTLVLSSFLVGQGIDLQELKKNQPTIKESYEQIKPLLSEKQKDYMEKQFQKLEDSEKQIVTFFYMTSTDLGDRGIKDFNASIKKLKKFFNVEGYVVIRGFSSNEDFEKFAYNSYVKGNPYKLKIHPMIFREFKLKSVPAYAVSICNKDKYFSFKKCENLYLAKGNGRLEDFLEKVSQRNMLFDKWYEELIKPDDDVGEVK